MRSFPLSLWSFDRNDPFRSLQEEVNRVFGRFGGLEPPTVADIRVPAVDVVDKGDRVEITVELAGVPRDAVELSVIDNVVSISGEKRTESEKKEEGAYLRERSYGAFARSIPLPFSPDPAKVTASARDGVLTITAPKPPEARKEARKIEIAAA